MERIAAAASGFLADSAAMAAATEVDRLREKALPELTEAFEAFRDEDESLARLARRIGGHLRRTWQPARGPAQNLWGFRNEEESRFLERFEAAAPRLPEVDLASLLRSHLEEAPESDEERVQILLAFAEFVAGLDQKGPDSERLGVGPAAHFFTFAWHCLSGGRDPVFTWSSDRGVRALAGSPGRDWEARIRTFYEVSREVVKGAARRPKSMRPGWVVEHVLAWAAEHEEGGGQEGGGTARPTIVPATRPTASRDAEPEALRTPGRESEPGAKVDRIRQITRKKASAAMTPPQAPPEPERERPKKQQVVRAETERFPTTGGQLESFYPPPDQAARDEEEISSERAELDARAKKKVKMVEADPMPRSGLSLEESLPPDRTPATAQPRPGSKKSSSPALPAKQPTTPESSGPFKTAAMLMRESREKDDRQRASETGDLFAEDPPAPPPEAPRAGAPRAAAPRAPEPAAPRRPEPPRGSPGAVTPAVASPRPGRGGVSSGSSEDDSDAGVAVDQLVSELRGEVVLANAGGGSATVPPDRLARDLLLEPALTGDLLAALDERGRLLLVGPPATGKTHVARRLAIHTAGHTDRVLFLRIHPEQRYQALIDGGAGQPGLLRDWCERARRDRDHRWALVLDELDRGDAARCLGELLGALAERGKGVLLASGAELVAPRNLVVIATAREEPQDPALVGRFPVVPLPADPAVLRRFLAQVRPTVEWAADLLHTLNQRLAAQEPGFRVGHGLFMDPDLDPSRLRRIWAREVLPLLRSHGVSTDGLEYDQIRPR